MKYLKVSLIFSLFCLSWQCIFSQCPTFPDGSVSQCSIAIDKSNTHLSLVNGQLVLKALVHHPFRGNDDDAHNVLITVTSDKNINNEEIIATKNNVRLEITNNGQFATISVEHLARNEHIDLQYTSIERCDYNLSVSAISMSTCDKDYTDNIWSIHSRCDASVIPIESIPQNGLVPFNIREICRHISSICDDCWSINGICANQLLQFNLPPNVSSFDLYKINNGVIQSRALSKSKFNGTTWDLKLPSSINKYKKEQLVFLIKKNKNDGQ